MALPRFQPSTFIEECSGFLSLKFISEMFLNLRLRLHIATGFGWVGWVGWVAQAFPHMKGWFTEITLSTCAATKSISGDSTCAVFQQCFRGHSGRWSRLSSGPVWVATRCVCHIFFWHRWHMLYIGTTPHPVTVLCNCYWVGVLDRTYYI